MAGRRMVRARCRVAASCPLCPVRIKPGQPIGMMFTTQQWAHTGCLIRWINQRKASAASV